MNRPKGFRGRPKGRTVDPAALADIRALLGAESRARARLIEHLHKIQDRYGHVGAPHLVALAFEMKLAPAEVYEVATFYHHFDVIKEGENPPPPLTVRVCDSLSCELAGAQELIGALDKALGGNVRVQPAPCVGRCDAAPVAVVGRNPISHATTEAVVAACEKKAVDPELLACVDYAGYDILEKGPDWFAGFGRRGRKGLRSFSVSGRINKPGVHLAPAGITLRELIDEYCGGMLPGHELYGYFPGGASGGILPARLADVPLDFGTLQEYGCFIGSAAIVVLSQHDSARAAALNTMRFFAHESCGKCTPCRVGTTKAARLMAEDKWDVALLEDLARVMEDASICGLGQAAPNPLRCVIEYFPEELS